MKEILDINVKESWSALSQNELEYVYGVMSERDRYLERDELQICIGLHLSGIRVLNGIDGLVEIKGQKIELKSRELSLIVKRYDWLQGFPDVPVRLEELRISSDSTVKGLSPMLGELTFEQYITADNYYQGLLQTEEEKNIDHITEILYPGIVLNQDSPGLRKSRLNTFYWWTSFKIWASHRWHYFLQPVGTKSGNNKYRISASSIRDSIDAQIRALTKGDVTKEQEVRNTPCHRALTELNALARETKEMEKKLKNRQT